MTDVVVLPTTKPKKRVFKDDIGLRHIDDRYFVYKVEKRLDPNIYSAHIENGKLVIAKLDEEITADEAKQYFLDMRLKVEKAQGAEAAGKVYDYYIKEFQLAPKEESEEEEEAEIVELEEFIPVE